MNILLLVITKVVSPPGSPRPRDALSMLLASSTSSLLHFYFFMGCKSEHPFFHPLPLYLRPIRHNKKNVKGKSNIYVYVGWLVITNFREV